MGDDPIIELALSDAHLFVIARFSLAQFDKNFARRSEHCDCRLTIHSCSFFFHSYRKTSELEHSKKGNF